MGSEFLGKTQSFANIIHSANKIFEMCRRTQLASWKKHACVFLDRNLLTDIEQASSFPSFGTSRARYLLDPAAPTRPDVPSLQPVNKDCRDLDIKLQASRSSSLGYLESFSEFSSGLIFQNLILLF